MVAYIVNQIIIGKLKYKEVVMSRPELKTEIDTYIEEKGLLIDKTV